MTSARLSSVSGSVKKTRASRPFGASIVPDLVNSRSRPRTSGENHSAERGTLVDAIHVGQKRDPGVAQDDRNNLEQGHLTLTQSSEQV